MAVVESYEMPDELYYHKEHMWARIEGTEATVGITDFAQKLAGDISFVDMPEESACLSSADYIVRLHRFGNSYNHPRKFRI